MTFFYKKNDLFSLLTKEKIIWKGRTTIVFQLKYRKVYETKANNKIISYID
jgi:3-methyladenine DNA glycosylase AlkD